MSLARRQAKREDWPKRPHAIDQIQGTKGGSNSFWSTCTALRNGRLNGRVPSKPMEISIPFALPMVFEAKREAAANGLGRSGVGLHHFVELSTRQLGQDHTVQGQGDDLKRGGSARIGKAAFGLGGAGVPDLVSLNPRPTFAVEFAKVGCLDNLNSLVRLSALVGGWPGNSRTDQ